MLAARARSLATACYSRRIPLSAAAAPHRRPPPPPRHNAAAAMSSSSGDNATVALRSNADAEKLRSAGSPYLDVRTPAEFAAGHAPGAVNVDFLALGPDKFVAEVERVLPASKAGGKPILIGCKSGGRSAKAAALLSASGYASGGILVDVQGGFDAWLASGLPVEK